MMSREDAFNVAADIRRWLEGSLPADKASLVRDRLRDWWDCRDAPVDLDRFMIEVGARIAEIRETD